MDKQTEYYVQTERQTGRRVNTEKHARRTCRGDKKTRELIRPKHFRFLLETKNGNSSNLSFWFSFTIE